MEPMILAQYPRVLPHEKSPHSRIIFNGTNQQYKFQELELGESGEFDITRDAPILNHLNELKTDRQWYHPSFNWQHYLFTLVLQRQKGRLHKTMTEILLSLPMIAEELVHHHRLGARLWTSTTTPMPPKFLEFSKAFPQLVIFIKVQAGADVNLAKPGKKVDVKYYFALDHPLSQDVTPEEWTDIVSIMFGGVPELKNGLSQLRSSLTEIKVSDLCQLAVHHAKLTEPYTSTVFKLQAGQIERIRSTDPSPILKHLPASEGPYLMQLLNGRPLDSI